MPLGSNIVAPLGTCDSLQMSTPHRFRQTSRKSLANTRLESGHSSSWTYWIAASLSATSHFGCLRWLGKTHHNTYQYIHIKDCRKCLEQNSKQQSLNKQGLYPTWVQEKSRNMRPDFFLDSHGLVWQHVTTMRRRGRWTKITRNSRHCWLRPRDMAQHSDHWGKQPLGVSPLERCHL